jgi:hypothetical protein
LSNTKLGSSTPKSTQKKIASFFKKKFTKKELLQQDSQSNFASLLSEDQKEELINTITNDYEEIEKQEFPKEVLSLQIFFLV